MATVWIVFGLCDLGWGSGVRDIEFGRVSQTSRKIQYLSLIQTGVYSWQREDPQLTLIKTSAFQDRVRETIRECTRGICFRT